MINPEVPFYQPVLNAWAYRGMVYEADMAGLAYHRTACAVNDTWDSDEDCTCGAHTLNKLLIATGANVYDSSTMT